ncbi:hypothetical protein M8J77_004929 [Diaphorina citri]|nr:hypothetical protein M8J77_004929 [Diaphorina citri]
MLVAFDKLYVFFTGNAINFRQRVTQYASVSERTAVRQAKFQVSIYLDSPRIKILPNEDEKENNRNGISPLKENGRNGTSTRKPRASKYRIAELLRLVETTKSKTAQNIDKRIEIHLAKDIDSVGDKFFAKDPVWRITRPTGVSSVESYWLKLSIVSFDEMLN